jgi:hypothetical protein
MDRDNGRNKKDYIVIQILAKLVGNKLVGVCQFHGKYTILTL